MECQHRLKRFRDLMGAEGLDGYWVVEAANVRYLSGFTGHDSTLLVTLDRCVLLTDSRYAEQAEAQAAVDEVVSRHGSMAQALAGQCKGAGLKRLGVTAANLTHAQFTAAEAACEPTKLLSRREGMVRVSDRRVSE